MSMSISNKKAHSQENFLFFSKSNWSKPHYRVVGNIKHYIVFSSTLFC